MLAVLTLALTVVAVVVTVLDHTFEAGDGGSVMLVPGFGLVGVVVARRQPRNPIGWCLLGCAFFLTVDDVASSYSVLAYRIHHGQLPLGPLAVLLQPSWAPAIVLIASSILLFPDGRVPSGWWRLPLGAFLLSSAVWLVGAFVLAADVIASHGVRVDSSGNPVQENHPTRNWAWWGISRLFFTLLVVVGFAWLVAQVPAYRHATGVRRIPLKWLLTRAATAVAGGMLTVTVSGSGFLGVVSAIGMVGLLGLPVSIGVGSSATASTRSTG